MDHLHSIVEADGERALRARHAWIGDPYRARRESKPQSEGAGLGGPLPRARTPHPREVRSTLLYVLQNWKKHLGRTSGLDGRSSGPWFDGWLDPPNRPSKPIPIAQARTWLAAEGWRRNGGGLLSVEEAPATRRAPSRERERSRSNHVSRRLLGARRTRGYGACIHSGDLWV
jgi:hypothetical protein